MNDLKVNKPIMFEMVDNMDYEVRIVDDKSEIVYMNKAMRKKFGDHTGSHCYSIFDHDDSCEKCSKCISEEAISNDSAVGKEEKIGDNYYKIIASPVLIGDRQYSIEMFDDITEKKLSEINLKKEIEVARNIQESILPKDGKYGDFLYLNSIYLPADDLGGDLFDIVEIDKDRIFFYIADVAGHGLQASLLTVFLRQVIRGHVDESTKDIATVIEKISDNFNDLDIDEEIYFSTLFCLYDKRQQELTIANAGHNCFPIIVRENGRVEEVQVKGLPISRLSKGTVYTEESTGLYGGERLILYTDGIIEEFNQDIGEPFGSIGVRKIIEKNTDMTGKDLIDLIIKESSKYVEGPFKDDRAIMVADIIG